MSSVKNRKKREHLMKIQHNMCYRCKKICKMPPVGDSNHKQEHDDAQFEHLYRKGDERRQQRHEHAVTVMTCFECNVKRNAEEQRKAKAEKFR